MKQRRIKKSNLLGSEKEETPKFYNGKTNQVREKNSVAVVSLIQE